MNAAPGMNDRRSTCLQLPTEWLYNIDNLDNTAREYGALVRQLLESTTSSFSHSSLYYHRDYGFHTSLLQLHRNTSDRFGMEVVPDDKKPIVRFFFGEPFGDRVPLSDIEDVYNDIVSELVAQVGASPANWNVKVAVEWSDTALLVGWNHTKMSIRDRVEVAVTSYETSEQELAMHLAGTSTEEAAEWFDIIWTQSDHDCIGDPAVCNVVPPMPPVTLRPPYPSRAAHVFALRRDRNYYEADDAILAGMDGAQKRIFFLNPGLVGLKWPYTSDYSAILIEKIADRLKANVDVKFVWGDQAEHVLTADIWQSIEDTIEGRFNALNMTQIQKDIGHCMFHVVSFSDDRAGARTPSHAKFFMLDEGFYVGSQNLYPSGFKGTPGPQLAEFGFYVDATSTVNADLSNHIVQRVASPIWERSHEVVAPSNYANCGALLHPARLSGSAQTSSGTYSCTNNFNMTLDFYHVAYDEVARASAQTTCVSGGYTVNVTIDGVIKAGGQFQGTISGNIPNQAADTAALLGTFRDGYFDLSFSGLEPIQGVPYSGTVRTHILPAPSSLVATALSGTQISLAWSDNSSDESVFEINNGVSSVYVAANSTSYTWGGLTPGTYMCFRVRAHNPAGHSDWTPWACATTPTVPAAPTSPSATAISGSQIRVNWADASNNESGFEVNNGVSSVYVPANSTSYTWGGLTPGTYMCFHIRAYNAAGSSAWTSYACTTSRN